VRFFVLAQLPSLFVIASAPNPAGVGLLPSVTEELLCGGIPAQLSALGCQAKDGVLPGFDNAGHQSLLRNFRRCSNGIIGRT
jgi:hypothetical protein